eukprot:CAMPEP_0113594808 /NCGR_PEP_ID=MMETSP0015_2-20120614/39296_1 /TAXON_ID=2838 /ORGANISM="Odontella" /LENGTH=793 /DNA_ID=CAMNT_0000501873 /DNA_START=138 /DNA_END=2520 /DNA_ORIENTATION=+ /assembly_acc=CAM_ASM_000160
MVVAVTESQRRIDELSAALARMQDTTAEAGRTCDSLTRRARHLDSLTSPASETSALLTQSSNNLGATLLIMKDAREKFDTVQDCEPAIQRLLRGAQEATEQRAAGNKPPPGGETDTGGNLTEQDVYAAADSMEIVRDAYGYFLERKHWRSTPSALGGLERVHQLGVDAMCLLERTTLDVRIKRAVKGKGGNVPGKNETAADTRIRLSQALQNRDLMKSVGEYEEYLPLDTRPVRELRAIFECLGGDGSQLGFSDGIVRQRVFPAPSKVVRTEKVGSGGYCNVVKQPLKTGFNHLDSYGEARKAVGFASIDGYYRHVKAERKKAFMRYRSSVSGGGATGDAAGHNEVDAAARDAVRCLEHSMVVVAGEKSIYRCVVSPTSSHSSESAKDVKPEYREALIASYSHVVSVVVDRCMDIIETVFLKDANAGGHATQAAEDGSTPPESIRTRASAAAAGLRILDGVRMLGPSLAKLCDLSHERQKGARGARDDAEPNTSVAGNLCIAIHRTTVKNTARTLENLAKAIQSDPLDGEKHRPRDARVAAVSSDVVRAIRLISPFVSAYKSVTKRRALPWDPNIGEEAGDMDSFVRFLIMRLLNSLQGKALNYTRDPGLDSVAKSNLFMMNNTFYLMEQLGSNSETPYNFGDGEIDGELYRIESPWFKEKVGKIFESEKNKYLAHWEGLNRHLTSVDKSELTFQGGSNQLLSLESGRLLKSRFSGFIEDFEKTYSVHKVLTVIDPKLRVMLQKDVSDVFYPRYRRFYEKYSKIQFSKKNMDQYLKLNPNRIEALMGELFTAQ